MHGARTSRAAVGLVAQSSPRIRTLEGTIGIRIHALRSGESYAKFVCRLCTSQALLFQARLRAIKYKPARVTQFPL